MDKVLFILLLIGAMAAAQPKLMQLQPYGFEPIEVAIPATPNEKLVEVTNSWAQEYNRREDGADITEVTANSITISAFKKNGFFYRNRGEAFEHRIRYTMKFTFYENGYNLVFTVNDIYVDNNVLLEYKLPDYFNSEGKLKEGYENIKPSLENTVNAIVQSHYDFLIHFR